MTVKTKVEKLEKECDPSTNKKCIVFDDIDNSQHTTSFEGKIYTLPELETLADKRGNIFIIHVTEAENNDRKE